MGDLAHSVQALLNEGVRLEIGSGAAAAWGRFDEIRDGKFGTPIFAGRASHLLKAGAIHSETIFDLASLTKILATTSLFMILDERGILRVDALLSDYFPDWVKAHPQLIGVTFKHLLSHTSGLPAWKPFYQTLFQDHGPGLSSVSIAQRKEEFYSLVLRVPREQEPGASVVYSDLGPLILSHLIEKFFQKSFDLVVQEWVWSQIPSCGLHFRPVMHSSLSERFKILSQGASVAMTEDCPWRGLLQGQVHDDNSWSMGGISGHTGAFGTLHDVQLWIQALFNQSLVTPATLQNFFREVSPPLHSRRGLGFDRVSTDGSGTTAFAFSADTVGHLGYTGTSMWMDLERGIYAVLLTNRVHPFRSDLRNRDLRREFHTRVGTED